MGVKWNVGGVLMEWVILCIFYDTMCIVTVFSMNPENKISVSLKTLLSSIYHLIIGFSKTYHLVSKTTSTAINKLLFLKITFFRIKIFHKKCFTWNNSQTHAKKTTKKREDGFLRLPISYIVTSYILLFIRKSKISCCLPALYRLYKLLA